MNISHVLLLTLMPSGLCSHRAPHSHPCKEDTGFKTTNTSHTLLWLYFNLVAHNQFENINTVEDTLDAAYEITKLIIERPNVRSSPRKSQQI